VNPNDAALRSNESRGWPGQSKYAADVPPPWIATMTARGSGTSATSPDIGTAPTITTRGRGAVLTIRSVAALPRSASSGHVGQIGSLVSLRRCAVGDVGHRRPPPRHRAITAS